MLKVFLKFSTELLQHPVIKRFPCSQEFLDLREIFINSSLFLFSVELFLYSRTSKDFVLGPDSNPHDEREGKGYFSISGFWF